MSNEVTPPASPPSPSAPSSPSVSRHWAGDLAAAAPATAAIIVVGRPLGQALPELIRLMGISLSWMTVAPVVANLLGLALLVAPVPTLALAKSVISRYLPAKKG